MWCFVNMQLVAYWAPLNLLYCLCALPCHASLNRKCIIIDCASCHVDVMVFYHVVCFFSGCFSRWLRFRSGVVRIRSTTSVCLFLGLILLPCRISGKMTIPSKSLLSLLASCSLYCYAALPIHLLFHASHIAMSAPNLFTLPSKPLLGYVTTFAQPLLIALLVAGEVEDCSMLDYVYVGISQYLLYY